MARSFLVFVFLVVFVSVVITACVEERHGVVEASLGESFVLEEGQSVLVGSEDLLVTFVGVVEDSRCPGDVVCVWAGEVVVALEVSFLGGDSVEAEVADVWRVDRYSIEVVDVVPYPVSWETVERYLARLVVGEM